MLSEIDKQILERAFRLSEGDESDFAGPRIVVSLEQNPWKGFVTFSAGDPAAACESRIVCHDGTVELSGIWEDIDPLGLLRKQSFRCIGSTFVLTAYYDRWERLFLNPNSIGFDAEHICQTLGRFRSGAIQVSQTFRPARVYAR